MTENNNIELVLKQQSVIDSCSECPIITYEIAKKLGFEKDKSLPNITNKVVSDIVKQQTQIFLKETAHHARLKEKRDF
ncbi:2508_t:CDS:2 [Dentiscutata erythropus]|uniref:2508_t:CDS:1 n=1 Tax=Dentiscutata erythropus TaxID=1348616 RepID=A0A9N9FSM8_9GLOM|nr:2508_t:CDS:2 [Dentiscutata erythropus]